MADNFDALTAAVNRVNDLVQEALTILQNPATNNNDQSVIDALTVRLTSIGDALSAAVPAPTTPATAPAATAPATDASATTTDTTAPSA